MPANIILITTELIYVTGIAFSYDSRQNVFTSSKIKRSLILVQKTEMEGHTTIMFDSDFKKKRKTSVTSKNQRQHHHRLV